MQTNDARTFSVNRRAHVASSLIRTHWVSRDSR
jgi:hypothetical protein